jgi:hypothetical protein
MEQQSANLELCVIWFYWRVSCQLACLTNYKLKHINAVQFWCVGRLPFDHWGSFFSNSFPSIKYSHKLPDVKHAVSTSQHCSWQAEAILQFWFPARVLGFQNIIFIIITGKEYKKKWRLLPKLPADVHGLTETQWLFPAISGLRELSTTLRLWLEYIIRKLLHATVCSWK